MPPPEPGANSNSHTEGHFFLFEGYQLDLIPEVGPVCVHADVCGSVSSFPGLQRILGVADPCRFFTLYLKLYQLIFFSSEISALSCPEITTVLTASLTPVPKTRLSLPKDFNLTGSVARKTSHIKPSSFNSEGHLTAYKTSRFCFFLLNVRGSLHWFK